MYKDILLPVDLVHESSWSKALGVAIARAKAFGARLHVLAVVPDYGFPYVAQFFPADYGDKALAAADQRLHAFVREHVPEEVPVQHVVAHGGIYDQILRVAEDVGTDLIVMASHRPEMQDYLLGSNADRVVRHAPLSVLVVRGEPRPVLFESILVPVDLHHESSWRTALPVAIEECRLGASRLDVMTVVPAFDLAMVGQLYPETYEKRTLEHAENALRALVREHVPEEIEPQTIVARGTIYQEILKVAEAKSCDLIVMASHRPELKDFLIGPNAARVVRHAACSVLVVRR